MKPLFITGIALSLVVLAALAREHVGGNLPNPFPADERGRVEGSVPPLGDGASPSAESGARFPETESPGIAPRASTSSLSILELGEELFYDPTLGGSANELSCNSCHNRGRGLENIPAGPQLMSAIKQCLVNEMGGSAEGAFLFMRELPAYVLSLSGKGAGASGNSPPDMKGGFRPGGLDARSARSGFSPGRQSGGAPDKILETGRIR